MSDKTLVLIVNYDGTSHGCLFVIKGKRTLDLPRLVKPIVERQLTLRGAATKPFRFKALGRTFLYELYDPKGAPVEAT